MRHARHIIAVTLMATAICADRKATAVPAEPPAAHLAGRIIARLSLNLRRVLPAVNLYQPRFFHARAIAAKPVAFADQELSFSPIHLSPFQFRLPPPVI
jgi:hypothetical protein